MGWPNGQLAFDGFGFLNGRLPCRFVYVNLTVAATMGSSAFTVVDMALFG
jgi:sulfite exporter TauE/SafE